MRIRVVRVHLDKPKAPPRSALDLMKDVGPVLTGIGTLLLSAVSAYYVHTMDKQKQALDAEKAAIEATNLHLKAVEAFDQDPTKREIAAITLAAYGKSSLPTLRIILLGGGSADSKVSKPMRDFAEAVAARLMDAGDPDTRRLLLSELRDLARAYTVPPRFEAFETLQKISPSLSASETDLVDELLIERFGTGTEKSQFVADTACPLISKCPFERCRSALRNMASLSANQCIEAYRTILGSNLPEDSCSMLLADLNSVIRATNSDPSYQHGIIGVANLAKGKCQKP